MENRHKNTPTMTESEIYQTIKAAVLSKGYVWFDSGDYDLNSVWIRMSDKVSNQMDDKHILCWFQDGKERAIMVEANTKPALYGALYRPVMVRGVTGTACTVPQQTRRAHKYVDLPWDDRSWNPWNQPHWSQIGVLKIWRDGNKEDLS